MSTKRMISIGLVLVAALVVLWWWLPTNTQSTSSMDSEESSPETVAKTRETVPKTRVVKSPSPRPVPALTPQDKATVYEQLQGPNQSRIRCSVGEDFPDGVVRTRGKQRVQFGLVQGGQFTGVVTTPEGQATLTQELRAVGTVSWTGGEGGDWAACTIEKLGRILISGHLLWPDGRPAQNHALTSCEHGEAVVTDETGAFEISAPQGPTCYLIGVVDSEDGLGRGPSVSIDTHEDVTGVEVLLPGDDELLGERQITQAAHQLARMSEMQMAEERKRKHKIQEVGQPVLSEEGAQAVQALREEDQWIFESMEETMRLGAPESSLEDKKEALRQMFYQTYH